MSLGLTFYNAVSPWFPNRGGFTLRRWLLGHMGIELGIDVKIANTARFYGSNISVGMGTWIGPETIIIGTEAGPVTIGANVDIGPGVLITSGSHEIGQAIRRAGPGASRPVLIHDGTWIGARSTIIAGAEVGEASIIGAGSVVIAGLYPAHRLLVGVPARARKPLQPVVESVGPTVGLRKV